MERKSKVIAITNQKGGVGKTVTTASLGVTLSERGNRVLLIDFDPQGNLTKGLGYRQQSDYKLSMKELLMNEILENAYNHKDCIIHTKESVDLVPSNMDLFGTDLMLVNVMSRECMLKQFIDEIKGDYDYILIDCNPSLNLFTINALTAADTVIIPVQAEPFSTDGLEDLLQTIKNVQQKLNPKLKVDGILLTMLDNRTNVSKHMNGEVHDKYGGVEHIFKSNIPRCVVTTEASLYGKSPILYSPKSASARAYQELAKEVEDIYESEKDHAVIFVGYDQWSIPKYAMKRFTTTNEKRDIAGSNKRHSFMLKPKEDSKVVHVFEGAIDLLSYCSLQKMEGKEWRKDYLLSLGGVGRKGKDIKESTLPLALEEFFKKYDVDTVKLHLDNDLAGKQTTDIIQHHLNDNYKVMDYSLKSHMDLNDYLCSKQKKIENFKTR